MHGNSPPVRPGCAGSATARRRRRRRRVRHHDQDRAQAGLLGQPHRARVRRLGGRQSPQPTGRTPLARQIPHATSSSSGQDSPRSSPEWRPDSTWCSPFAGRVSSWGRWRSSMAAGDRPPSPPSTRSRPCECPGRSSLAFLGVSPARHTCCGAPLSTGCGKPTRTASRPRP